MLLCVSISLHRRRRRRSNGGAASESEKNEVNIESEKSEVNIKSEKNKREGENKDKMISEIKIK
jgi:hypothetical protein